MASYTLTNSPVTIGDLKKIVIGGVRLEISQEVQEKIKKSEEYLQKLFTENRVIYSVTTGTGPHSSTYFSPSKNPQAQREMIYTMITGVGPPLTEQQVRAVMAVRLVNLSCGVSASRNVVTDKIAEFLNKGLVPYIPSLGTIGASGDLCPLAHFAEVLCGGGSCLADGKMVPAEEVLKKNGIEPLDPRGKDSTALINGTAAMAGIAAVNHWMAEGIVQLGLRLGFAAVEVLRGKALAFHPSLAKYRPHPGQIWVHREMEPWVAESKRLERADQSGDVLPDGVIKGAEGTLRGQPAPLNEYSLRCMPQFFGAIKDTLDFHGRTVETEINSATDNPLLLGEENLVLHGGNFFGQHVANVSDHLSLAVIQCGIHAERVVARLLESARNRGLPSYIPGDTSASALCNGLVGIQLTATSLLAEMRVHSTPASIQSIDTSSGVQDINTMGTIAARRVSQLIDMVIDLLAIESIVVAQAIDVSDGELEDYSTSTRELYEMTRKRCAFMVLDRALSSDISAVAHSLNEYIRSQ